MKRSKLYAAAGFIALVAVAYDLPADAQSPCAVLAYGVVPTVAQWQSCFQAKQDLGGSASGGITASQVIAALGYTPVNKSGDTLLGELTFTAGTTGAASLNIPPGVAPSAPVNGDVWETTAGVFARVNGSNVNLGTGSGGVSTISGACTGTASGGNIALTCPSLAAVGSSNTFTATNTFAGTIVARRTLSTNGTLTLSDNAVCINSNGSALTATMPAGPTNGLTLSIDDCFKNSATHNITVAAGAGQTISTGASVVLNVNGAAISAVWNSVQADWNLF